MRNEHCKKQPGPRKGRARALQKTRTMVGGISGAVGNGLEDRPIQAPPTLLPELVRIEAEERFVKKWGNNQLSQFIELNPLGYARKASGDEITVVGEAKARARIQDVNQLQRLLAGLRGTSVMRGELLEVLFSYSVRPELEKRAQQAGVLFVPSYRLNV